MGASWAVLGAQDGPREAQDGSKTARQRELKVHPSGLGRIFTDLNDAWHPNIKNKFRLLEARRVPIHIKDLDAIVKSPRAIDLSQLKCCKHPGESCGMSFSSVHFAGPPCIEYSPQGGRQLGLGPAGKTLGAWAALRTHAGKKATPTYDATPRGAMFSFPRGRAFSEFVFGICCAVC